MTDVIVNNARFVGPDGQIYFFATGSNLWMNYFEDFSTQVDEQLKEVTIRLQNCYLEFTNQESPPLIIKSDLETTSEFCENLQRGFLFVATYSFAEAELKRWCYQLRNERNNVLPFKNIQTIDRSIEKAYMYLTKVLGFNLPDNSKWSEWQQLKKYQELRNRVVHNQACLEKNDANLRNFAKSHKYLSIGEGKGLTGENIVTFHNGFCREVAKTIRVVLMTMEKHMSTNRE